MIDIRLDDGFKTSADTALQCLYIAVDRSIADDINARVRRYIEKLEEAARGKGELVEALEGLLEAAIAEVNEKCSRGFILLQISDAKALLNRLKEPNVKS